VHIDDHYNKLRKNIGSDFGKGEKVNELYSFRCGNCCYRNIHDVKVLTCGCGKELHGTLVYRKVGDVVIYDTREGRKGRK
jgi:hypothetical protein